MDLCHDSTNIKWMVYESFEKKNTVFVHVYSNPFIKMNNISQVFAVNMKISAIPAYGIKIKHIYTATRNIDGIVSRLSNAMSIDFVGNSSDIFLVIEYETEVNFTMAVDDPILGITVTYTDIHRGKEVNELINVLISSLNDKSDKYERIIKQTMVNNTTHLRMESVKNPKKPRLVPISDTSEITKGEHTLEAWLFGDA